MKYKSEEWPAIRPKIKTKREELARKRPEKRLNMVKYTSGFDIKIDVEQDLESLIPSLESNRQCPRYHDRIFLK